MGGPSADRTLLRRLEAMWRSPNPIALADGIVAKTLHGTHRSIDGALKQKANLKTYVVCVDVDALRNTPRDVLRSPDTRALVQAASQETDAEWRRIVGNAAPFRTHVYDMAHVKLLVAGTYETLGGYSVELPAGVIGQIVSWGAPSSSDSHFIECMQATIGDEFCIFRVVGDYDDEAPYVDVRSRFAEFVVYPNGADSAVTVVNLCVDQIGDITIHASQGSEVAAGYVPLFVNNGCFDFHMAYTAMSRFREARMIRARNRVLYWSVFDVDPDLVELNESRAKFTRQRMMVELFWLTSMSGTDVPPL